MLNPRLWPWWGWATLIILTVLALLLSAGAIVRMQGEGELRRVFADLRSKNLIYLPAEFAKLAPPVDEDRQERAWAQQQRIIKEKWATFSFSNNMSRFSSKPPLRTDQQLVTDSQVERLAWRNLYTEGSLLLTGFGWMGRDFPHPEQIGIAKASSLRLANLLGTRALANALAASAMVAPNPQLELADLDALVTSLEPGCSLIDAMILGAVANIRDLAWLEATTRGSDPTAWIARPTRVNEAVIMGFSGDRAWHVGGLYQDYLQGRTFGGVLSSELGGWVGTFLWSAVAPHDLALGFHCEAQIEERLRGQPVDMKTLERRLQTESWLHPISNIMIPNLIESGITGIQLDVTANRLRIAAAIMHNFHHTKQLPSDTAAVRALLPSDLFAANGDRPAIIYSVIAPKRFRLWTDPSTPATDLLPAGRIDAPKPTSAGYSEGKWWLELDMTQLPTP